MFVMEPSSENQVKQPTTKVMYDKGHDNKVFVGEGLPQPQFTNSQNNGTNGTNGSTNVYYPNGNAHTNVNSPNEDMQPTYRVIENSRL